METKSFFSIWNCQNILIISFRFISIIMLWVYGPYKDFNSFSAGTDISRQNLTSKVGPRTVRIKIFVMAVDPQYELIRTFMMVSNWKKTF